MLVLASCSQSKLESESGLYDVPLHRHLKSPTDGIWTWGKGNPYLNQKSGFIYIAPMDIRKARAEEPELAPLMIPQMHDYMVQEFVRMLREANQKNAANWQLTFDPAQAHVRIDTALVHFRPQRPIMRIFGKILGYVSPIPLVGDVVGKFSKGDITIEATIRDCKDGKLLLAFKDSNRKNTRLIQAEAYSKTGNADANLRSWAHVIAKLCRAAWKDRRGGSTLKEAFDNYTYAEALRDRIMD